MGQPQFLKAGVPTVTFAKSRVFPVRNKEEEPNQILGEADDGTPQVAELGPTVRYHDLTLERLPSADIAAALAFLNHALVRWALSSFTFRDEEGIAHLVRYWGPFPRFSAPQVGPDLYHFSCLLREEL